MSGAALALLVAIAAFVPALQSGDTVPAIPLVDQDGTAFDLSRFRGTSLIVSFIYTRCADRTMCPLVSAKFARLQRRIGTARVRLLEISLDPRFDTPRVLERYGAAFGQNPARWTLATGAPGAIDEFAGRLNIATRWTAPGTLVHTEAVAIIDPAGRLAETIDGNRWEPDDVLALAADTAGASSSPAARARSWLSAAIETCGASRLGVPAAALLLLLATAVAVAALALFRTIRLPARRR